MYQTAPAPTSKANQTQLGTEPEEGAASTVATGFVSVSGNSAAVLLFVHHSMAWAKCGERPAGESV